MRCLYAVPVTYRSEHVLTDAPADALWSVAVTLYSIVSPPDVILSLSVPADTTIQLPAINTVVIIGITILFIFLIIKQSPFHIQLNF